MQRLAAVSPIDAEQCVACRGVRTQIAETARVEVQEIAAIPPSQVKARESLAHGGYPRR